MSECRKLDAACCRHCDAAAIATDTGIITVRDFEYLRQVVARQCQISAPVILPADVAEARESISRRPMQPVKKILMLVTRRRARAAHDQTIVRSQSKRRQQSLGVGRRLTAWQYVAGLIFGQRLRCDLCGAQRHNCSVKIGDAVAISIRAAQHDTARDRACGRYHRPPVAISFDFQGR